MDLQFYGANCITLASKGLRVVVDDNLSELGSKTVSRDGDICLFTGAHDEPKCKPKIVVDQPGEYEVSGLSIFGIQARAHTDEADQQTAVIYKVVYNELRIAIVGHIFPKLSDNDLEALGVIDTLIVPVGGNGYTLDGTGAMDIIRAIEPKLIIPTHYADPSLKYPVPQQSLGDVLKSISIEPKETVQKLQLKSAELTDSTQLVILERA